MPVVDRVFTGFATETYIILDFIELNRLMRSDVDTDDLRYSVASELPTWSVMKFVRSASRLGSILGHGENSLALAEKGLAVQRSFVRLCEQNTHSNSMCRCAQCVTTPTEQNGHISSREHSDVLSLTPKSFWRTIQIHPAKIHGRVAVNTNLISRRL